MAIDKVATAARYQPTDVDDDKSDYNSDSEEVRTIIVVIFSISKKPIE